MRNELVVELPTKIIIIDTAARLVVHVFVVVTEPVVVNSLAACLLEVNCTAPLCSTHL